MQARIFFSRFVLVLKLTNKNGFVPQLKGSKFFAQEVLKRIYAGIIFEFLKYFLVNVVINSMYIFMVR